MTKLIGGMMEGENWVSVPGYEGAYEISDHGKIRSLVRTIEIVNRYGPCRVRRGGLLLKGTPAGDGYLQVGLSFVAAGKKQRWFKVHRLVCATFHGPAPDGKPYALHRDDDKMNNTAANLYWGTNDQNMRDMVINDRSPAGIRHPKARLTESAVHFIRANYRAGHPEFGGLALAARFGVDDATVSHVVVGRTWRHLKAA